MKRDAPDAIVVGSGPNGLAAAITLARAGRSVVVVRGAATVGGGMRSAELTLPGIRPRHLLDRPGDVDCVAVLPRPRPGRFGLELIDPPAPLAHPLDDGRVAVLERSVAETAAGLGEDRAAYRQLMGPLVRDADKIMDLRPRHRSSASRATRWRRRGSGSRPLRSAVGLAGGRFRESRGAGAPHRR